MGLDIVKENLFVHKQVKIKKTFRIEEDTECLFC